MERTSGRSIAPHTAIFQSHIDRGGGGQEKGLGGTSQDPERSSFQSKACAHGVSSSSKEQRNIRFVAREKTSGADQGDPTKGVGIFTRTPSGIEPEDFHQVFAGRSLWKFTRSRGCNQRDVEGVSADWWRNHWHGSLAWRWSECVLHFSSPCPHGQEWIVWGLQCGLPLIQIREQLCCL